MKATNKEIAEVAADLGAQWRKDGADSWVYETERLTLRIFIGTRWDNRRVYIAQGVSDSYSAETPRGAVIGLLETVRGERDRLSRFVGAVDDAFSWAASP
jgi:hypothetical protein